MPRESDDPGRTNPPTPPDPATPRAPEVRGSSRGRGKPLLAATDASLFGLGSQMFSEVVAGVLLGYGIDYWLGTRNRWIVVGAIAGIVVAMATVLRTAMRLGAKAPRSSTRPAGAVGSGPLPRREGSAESDGRSGLDPVGPADSAADPRTVSRDGAEPPR